jgi:hypothetical protein
VATWFSDQVNDMLQREREGRPEEGGEEEAALPPNIVPLTGPDRVTTAGARLVVAHHCG